MRVKCLLIIAGIFFLLALAPDVMAQCSICTKVAADQSDGAAKGFNAGILYLAAIPFTAVGIVGYRWWKTNLPREKEDKEH